MTLRAFSSSTFASLATLAVATSLAGCVARDVSEPGEESVQQPSTASLSAFGRSLVGTFSRIDGAGAPRQLTFNVDGSFADESDVQCFRAPCPVLHETGTFTAVGTGTSGTLALKSTSGWSRSYSVALQSDGAVLELTSPTATQHMARAPKICGGITGRVCSSMVATVEATAGKPSLFVQALDGSSRQRLRFNNIADDLAGNGSDVLPVTDGALVAISGVSFSADGSRLAAVVSVGLDEAQVIVLDLDTGIGHIASPTEQYVMGTPDWSLDGTKIAYAMSVAPSSFELFTTDLAGRTVKQVTGGTGLPGLGVGGGMRVRFVSAADAILFSQTAGSAPPPSSDWITNVLRADVATGVVRHVTDGIVGSTVDLARDQKTVLVLRELALGSDGVVDSALLLRTVATGAEKVLLAHGQHDSAAFARDGAMAVSLTDVVAADGTHAFSMQRVTIATGATTTTALPATTRRAEVFIAR